MSSIQQNTAETSALRAEFNQKMGPGTHIFPLANALAEKLEEYAIHITRCQASQISLFLHEETTDFDSQGDKDILRRLIQTSTGTGLRRKELLTTAFWNLVLHCIEQVQIRVLASSKNALGYIVDIDSMPCLSQAKNQRKE
jgi:hypothetical protein